jgi:hypothetical protein
METETATETKSILRNTSNTDVPDNKVTEVEVQLASIATNNAQLLRETRLPGTETATETKLILRNTSNTDVPDDKVTDVEAQLASIATNNVLSFQFT